MAIKYLDDSGLTRYDNNIKNVIATKVSKTSTASQVYATDGSGNQTTYTLGTSSGNIPKYDSNARLQSASPSANTDVANKQYVDGKFPTNFGYATPNSTYIKSGQCQYIQYGKIVLVYINAVQFKNVRQEHDAVIFSGLPTCPWGVQINLTAWGNTITARYCMVAGTGNMANYWSAFTPTESPEQVFSGMFMYETN